MKKTCDIVDYLYQSDLCWYRVIYPIKTFFERYTILLLKFFIK